MDEFATVDVNQGNPPPEKLQALFNDPEQARVQPLPCALEGLGSKAVHFPAGVRNNPHVHTKGQHIIVTHGIRVVGDETGVRVVRAGDVISSPPVAGTGTGPCRPRPCRTRRSRIPGWISTSNAATTTRRTPPTWARERRGVSIAACSAEVGCPCHAPACVVVTTA